MDCFPDGTPCPRGEGKEMERIPPALGPQNEIGGVIGSVDCQGGVRKGVVAFDNRLDDTLSVEGVNYPKVNVHSIVVDPHDPTVDELTKRDGGLHGHNGLRSLFDIKSGEVNRTRISRLHERVVKPGGQDTDRAFMASGEK